LAPPALWTAAVLAGAAALLAPAPARAQEAARLAWRLEAGQALEYTFTWVIDRTQEVDGLLPPQGMRILIATTTRQQVQEVDAAGAARIEATIAQVSG